MASPQGRGRTGDRVARANPGHRWFEAGLRLRRWAAYRRRGGHGAMPASDRTPRETPPLPGPPDIPVLQPSLSPHIRLPTLGFTPTRPWSPLSR
jgi:hypothetical protein